MLPLEPDVIAYDENMIPIYQWSGVPDVASLDDLPMNNRVAQMALSEASLIRRRDGLVLLGNDPAAPDVDVDEPIDLVLSDEIVLPPTIEPPRRPEPVRLERVELIPPAQELAEHDPLDDTQMLEVALFTALHNTPDAEIAIDDRDILTALTRGSISVERFADGTVVYRAHTGDLSHFRVGQAEVHDTGLVHKDSVIKALDEVFLGETRPRSMMAGYDKAVEMISQLEEQ